ncbi:unnamed protein product [Trichogramma brassicae]|uniref:Uncharacterized protein n=1 Tax=Trichogramma brassicae TaxID=86971 RepID=A0A6H5IZE7_9HYME|nr:unnamed protein product [Trichogramma brassicae]
MPTWPRKTPPRNHGVHQKGRVRQARLRAHLHRNGYNLHIRRLRDFRPRKTAEDGLLCGTKQ